MIIEKIIVTLFIVLIVSTFIGPDITFGNIVDQNGKTIIYADKQSKIKTDTDKLSNNISTPLDYAINVEEKINEVIESVDAGSQSNHVIESNVDSKEISTDDRKGNCDNEIPVQSISSNSTDVDNNNLKNILDKNYSTAWSTKSKDSFLLLNLAGQYDICNIQIGFKEGSESINFVLIQTSKDGIKYEPPILFQNSGLTSGFESIRFEQPIPVNYLKITPLGTTSDTLSINEIEIKGRR